MARIKNHRPTIITLPPIRCEESGESMPGYTLPPGESLLSDDFIARALGTAKGDNAFIIRGAQDGHSGIKRLFIPKLKILELLEGDEVVSLFPAIQDMSAGEAIELVESTDDKATLHHWLKGPEKRTTVRKALDARAALLGLEVG